MDTLEAIKERKSTRAYRPLAVEKEKISIIAQAGNLAAKAGKIDIVVITNVDIINEIQRAAKNVMLQSGVKFLINRANTPGYEVLYNAPAAIAIVIDSSTNEQSIKLNTANAACAGENMLLAATELGLGSCYTVASTLAFQDPKIKELVGINANQEVSCIISVGYAQGDVNHANRTENNIRFVE